MFGTISDINDNSFDSKSKTRPSGVDNERHRFNPSSSQIVKQIREKSKSVNRILGLTQSTSAKELKGNLADRQTRNTKIQPSE